MNNNNIIFKGDLTTLIINYPFLEYTSTYNILPELYIDSSIKLDSSFFSNELNYFHSYGELIYTF
jgi:hypothetical protein